MRARFPGYHCWRCLQSSNRQGVKGSRLMDAENRVIPLLRGASAFQWQRREVVTGRFGVGLTLLGAVLAGIYLAGVSFLLLPAAVILGLGLLAWRFSNYRYLVALRDTKEVAAGYTTLAHPHRPELPLVSYRTGNVVRDAGAPGLSEAEYKAEVERSA